MQFRATHFMSLQNALYSIPSVQRTLCHCNRLLITILSQGSKVALPGDCRVINCAYDQTIVEATMLDHKRSVRRVNSSVLLTHFTAKISPIRVNGTLFGHFSIIRQSNSYL